MNNGDAAIADGHDIDSRADRVPAPALPGSMAPLSRNSKQTVHKRSLSGGILSRLNFLRTAPEGARPSEHLDLTFSTARASLASTASTPTSASNTSPASSSGKGALHHDGESSRNMIESSGALQEVPVSPVPESSMALSQRVAKQRKRKGSLRKTALLGTGRLAVKERRNSLLQRSKNAEEQLQSAQSVPPLPQPVLPSQYSEPAQVQVPFEGLTYNPPPPITPMFDSSLSAADLAQPKLSLDTVRRVNTLSAPPASVESTLASPIVSPTSQSYTSTTDDDDALTLPNAALIRPPMPTANSYFPTQTSLQRRRSSKKPPSPLSAIPVTYGTDEDYDYSETEWWGWVVLVVTWIVFVVGMGSCFGLWSWAWDVGETPYAPPELEDDPTLPIVGYYPALIILSGVMAWVWVVVAWVGMKYFKHAKMAGEDV